MKYLGSYFKNEKRSRKPTSFYLYFFNYPTSFPLPSAFNRENGV